MRYIPVLLVLLALLCFGSSSLREAKARSDAHRALGLRLRAPTAQEQASLRRTMPHWTMLHRPTPRPPR
jgi:hypothetical protein